MILQYIFLLFCFFPFVGPHIGTDMQPFALLMAIILLLLKGKIVIPENNARGLTFCVMLIALFTITSFAINDPFQVLKRLFSYVSIFLIPIAVYNCITLSKDKVERILKGTILIYLFVGLIQKYLYPGFMTQLMSYYRNPFGRGVCSLTCEPSFYGYMMFFFFLMATKFEKNKYIYLLLCLFQVVFLSQSVTVFLYFGIFAIFYFIGSHKFLLKKVFAALAVVIFAILGVRFILYHMQGTRMYNLFYMFINGGFAQLGQDQSVIERNSSLKLAFSGYGLPVFLGKTTIMSGIGGIIYDMGVFGIPVIWCIFKPLFKKKNILWVYGITIFICMFSAIQLSSPTLSLIIGLVIKSNLVESIQVSSNSGVDDCKYRSANANKNIYIT